MMQYECVPFHKIGHEIAKNVVSHYEDVKKKEGLLSPDVDWKGYIELSDAGQCVAFIAKDGDKLVGYAVFVISNDMNHKSVIEASNTALFVNKEYRTKITKDFMKFAHDKLLESGLSRISYMVNDDRLGRLLQSAGLKNTHKLWTIENE